jgi:hypothetical protein
MVWYFLLLKKAPKSHFEPFYFALLVWFTYHPVEGRVVMYVADHESLPTP